MNRQNLNNPNNDAYWEARGYKKRPKNWKELITRPSKRSINRARYMMDDGRCCVDSMFDPLCAEDY